jgi:hypothetical protein
MGSGPPTLPVSYTLPCAELIRVGPHIRATWRLPEAHAQRLEAAGRRPPPAVHGMMLIDTGADATCIGEDAAVKLGLQPRRQVPLYGAGGKIMSNVYYARFEVSVGVAGRVVTVSRDLETIGLPDLEKAGHEAGLPGVHADGPHGPVSAIGVVGRDFLRWCTFTYMGHTGQYELVIDTAGFSSPK